MSSTSEREAYNVSANEQRKHATKSNLKAVIPTGLENVAAVTSDSIPEQGPTFRSAVRRPGSIAARGSSALNINKEELETGVIDKKEYLKPSTQSENKASNEDDNNWNVRNESLRSVPNYYPLEKSSRFVSDSSANEIATRISESCRMMSVQAMYDSDLATASLKTSEHVDIHLSLWQGKAPRYPNCIIVEAQRRKGDAVVFHHYCRNLLDAAQGEFNSDTFITKEKLEQKYTTIASELLEERESSTAAGTERENFLFALEIAAGLIKKDRMDARQLGMESLCLLTDPTRTGKETALLASKVVLLGTIHDENATESDLLQEELGIREAVLSLVQFGRLGEGGEFSPPNESNDEDNELPDEKSHNDILHNLALAVLSNALEVLENQTAKIDPNKSVASITNTFLDESTDISSRDLLRTLLGGLEQAEAKPHDACLSAKCLKFLFQASQKARRKARSLNAKQIVATALDIGRRTHVKLEEEAQKVITALEKPDTEEGDE